MTRTKLLKNWRRRQAFSKRIKLRLQEFNFELLIFNVQQSNAIDIRVDDFFFYKIHLSLEPPCVLLSRNSILRRQNGTLKKKKEERKRKNEAEGEEEKRHRCTAAAVMEWNCGKREVRRERVWKIDEKPGDGEKVASRTREIRRTKDINKVGVCVCIRKRGKYEVGDQEIGWCQCYRKIQKRSCSSD